MNNQDMDHLLEQGLSGAPPRQVFRARVRMDSTEAFLRARGGGARWRLAALSAAAVFIGGVSFLLGRYSAARPAHLITAGPSDTVAVSSDLVAWLQAAQLFGQLGMNDRMARAVERASKLLPDETIIVDSRTLQGYAVARSAENGEEGVEPMGMPSTKPSVPSVNQVLAQALGD